MLGSDLPEEIQFSMNDLWSRRVFVALLRRYGIRPYRYPRQRHTTVMARMPRRFLGRAGSGGLDVSGRRPESAQAGTPEQAKARPSLICRSGLPGGR
jgi:hypothetical protein